MSAKNPSDRFPHDTGVKVFTSNDPRNVEIGATDFNDISTFTVLRESNGQSLLRAFTLTGEITPVRPNVNVLGLGKCLEIALQAVASHKVTCYRVGNQEPIRFVFESRTAFPDPPLPWPAIVPAGDSWPVTWYRCRILPDVIDISVAGANFSLSSTSSENWTEVAHLITALTPSSPYRAVVEGEATTGHPQLRISRSIR